MLLVQFLVVCYELLHVLLARKFFPVSWFEVSPHEGEDQNEREGFVTNFGPKYLFNGIVSTVIEFDGKSIPVKTIAAIQEKAVLGIGPIETRFDGFLSALIQVRLPKLSLLNIVTLFLLSHFIISLVPVHSFHFFCTPFTMAEGIWLDKITVVVRQVGLIAYDQLMN